MRISKLVIVVGLLAALSLAACAQPRNNAQVPNTGAMSQTPETMMGTETPGAMAGTATTDSMAKTPDAMMGTPTGDAMMAETPDAMMGTPTGDAMMTTPTGAMMQTGTPGAMMEAPAWFSAMLTDVRTGKPFTINDFKGKVVVVQNIAAGSGASSQQSQQLKALSAVLGSDSHVVFVGLDSDPQDNAAALKAYAAEKGFDGVYAIAPKAVSDALVHLYGDPFRSAQTAPLLIIDTHGEAHPLKAGVMSADELKKAVEMYSGM